MAVTITKNDWKRYRMVQNVGHYNMLDDRARQEAGLSVDKWIEIIKNYSKYEEMFED